MSKAYDHEDTRTAFLVLTNLWQIMKDSPQKDVIVELCLLALPYIISTLEQTYKVQVANQN